jgi:hypothetical protein
LIEARVVLTANGLAPFSPAGLSIYKNGSEFLRSQPNIVNVNVDNWWVVSTMDACVGTDFYEVYVQNVPAGWSVSSVSYGWTFFQGTEI